MRYFVGACVLVCVFLVAACGGDEEGPTPTPTATSTSIPESTATPTPTPSPTPTSTPTATATPTETPVPPTETPVPPTETPVPTATSAPPAVGGGGGGGPGGGGGGGGGGTLFVTAAGLQFSPRSLATSAGASTTIVMSNQDARVPHNIAVSGLGTSATCAGPCSASVSFVAPAPGNYAFHCTVHPFMTGTLTVR